MVTVRTVVVVFAVVVGAAEVVGEAVVVAASVVVVAVVVEGLGTTTVDGVSVPATSSATSTRVVSL